MTSHYVYNVKGLTMADNRAMIQWHVRLGHRNFRDIAKLLGIPYNEFFRTYFCQACVQGKSQRHAIGRRHTALHEAPRPGYMLHSDAAGPFQVPTINQAIYALFHVDDDSRLIILTLTRTLSEYYERFKDIVKQIESQFGNERAVAQIKADRWSTIFRKITTFT